MGNLLGAPVTIKETHRGVTKDEKLKFGLSSMQGWRVHMEDAHIAEGELYALETDQKNGSKGTKIPLKGHSLFAVYDGHGGTFAAIYSGNNFLRILSKQPKFVKYAKMCASSDSDRATKMRVLEQALKQAFVETDYEIGLAVRGKSHVDANSPYHDPPPPVAASAQPRTISSNPTDEGSENEIPNDGKPPQTPNLPIPMAGAAMKAASDHLSAIEDDGDSGTTTCVVVITPDSIVCANAGDSRAVFARRPLPASPAASPNSSGGNLSFSYGGFGGSTPVGKAIALSFDHKPDDEEEEKRVRNAGGYVTGGRVEGDLAVSRGLGDFRFKQMEVVLNNTQLYPDDEGEKTEAPKNSANNNTSAPAESNNSGGGEDTEMATDDEDEGDDSINNKTKPSLPLTDSVRSKPLILNPGDQKVSPIPDVTIHMRNHERDEYIVVACDGIWDVVSNQQCINELDEIMYAEGERDLGLVSEEILDTCLRYGSKDNMTTIIVQLPGCEKSYAEAAKNASVEAGRKTTDDSKTTNSQEGVTGRRRKREEAMSAAQQQQQSGTSNHADAIPYGGSAPE